MSKRQLIILFGALIIIIALFSGFPAIWNKVLNIIIGLLTIVVAYTTTKSASSMRKASSSPYVDVHGRTSPVSTDRAPKIVPDEPAESPEAGMLLESTEAEK